MSEPIYRLIIEILRDEKNAVAYRPKIAMLIGGVTATLLLQQITYWWGKNNGKPFYKFRTPCSHRAYQHGQSWVEEIAFGEAEFDGALKRIATKVKPKGDKTAILEDTEVKLNDKGLMANTNSLVMYWTGQDHVTYYELNEVLFYKLLLLAYREIPNQEIPNQEIPNQEIPNPLIQKTSIRESRKSQSDRTEINTENNHESKKAAIAAPTPIKQKKETPEEHPAVKAYRDTFRKTPTEPARKLIAAKVTDLELWQTNMDEWSLSGWNPLNVNSMVARYLKLAGNCPAEKPPSVIPLDMKDKFARKMARAERVGG